MTHVRMVRPGSEPLLEQVSREVGSGVHMISLGAVPPRHLASHWSRHTCAFQPSCYLRSRVLLGMGKMVFYRTGWRK